MPKAGSFTIGIKGLDSLRARIAKLDKGEKKGLRVAMDAALQPAFQQTQKLVPVGVNRRRHRAGTLKRSGRISIRLGKKQVTAKILYGDTSYGDDKAYYALHIHERLDLRHPRGGQAKFVESVARGYPFLAKLAQHIDLEQLLWAR